MWESESHHLGQRFAFSDSPRFYNLGTVLSYKNALGA
jgi:hypothetical protein